MLKLNSCAFCQCVNYEAESTPKIELLLRRTECRIAKSVFVESQLVPSNQIIIFLSFRRIGFHSVDLYLDQQFSFQRNRSFLSSCLLVLLCVSFVAFSHLFLMRINILRNIASKLTSQASHTTQIQISQLQDYYADEVGWLDVFLF